MSGSLTLRDRKEVQVSKTVRVACTVVLVVVACLAAQPLRAQTVLISNLPGNDGSQSADLDELRNKGMGFTMPTGPNYILNHVTFRLATFGAVQPRVELWSNVAGLPGAMI